MALVRGVREEKPPFFQAARPGQDIGGVGWPGEAARGDVGGSGAGPGGPNKSLIRMRGSFRASSLRARPCIFLLVDRDVVSWPDPTPTRRRGSGI